MNTGMNRYESTLHLSQGMTEKVITSRGKLKAQVSSLKSQVSSEIIIS